MSGQIESVDGEKGTAPQHLDHVTPLGRAQSGGSDQLADVAPLLQARAVIVTVAAGLFWIVQLFMIIVLAGYSRNIVAALGDAGKQAWVLNAFNVVTISFGPVFAHFSDLHGRKWIIVVAMAFGVVGSAVASQAKSTNLVIVGTALCGVPGATIGVITAIPSEVLPHRWRSVGQAAVFVISATAAFPALLGISKAISLDAANGWRWAFRAGLIGYGLMLPLWIFAYSPPPRVNDLTRNRPSLDYIGYGLLIGGTIPLLMGLTWGGTAYAWQSVQVLTPLIVGIALYLAFAGWEWKGRKDGLLHHDLFRNRNFGLTLGAIAIEGFVYLSYSALYPGETALVYDHDVFRAGIRSIYFYFAFLLSLPIGAYYVSKTRDTTTPIIVGYVIFTGGCIGMACATPSTSGLFIAMSVLAGLGFAQPLTFLTVVGQFAAPAELIGTATAVVLTARALGGSIGIAVINAVLESKISSSLPAYIAKATLPLGLDPRLLGPVIGAAASGNPHVIAEVSHIPGITPQILGAAFEAAEAAFSYSYRHAWLVVIPFSAVGALSIFSLKKNAHQLDYIIDAPLAAVHHKSDPSP